MVKGLIFDMDGVVIDSERYRDRSTDNIFASIGVPYNRDRTKPLLSGKGEQEVVEHLVSEYDLRISPVELRAMRRGGLHEIYARLVPFVPGFEAFFTRLRGEYNVPVALATGCDPDLYALVDRRLHITEMFDGHAYLSQHGMRSKPEPDVFLHAASKLNVPATETVIFEDAGNGIVAGLRAGARVVAFTRTFTSDMLERRVQSFGLSTHGIIYIDDYRNDSYDRVRRFLDE